MATNLVLRADVNSRLVTFSNFSLTGDVMHTWLTGAFGVQYPTLDGAVVGLEYHPDWVAYDSHLLLSSSWSGLQQLGVGYK